MTLIERIEAASATDHAELDAIDLAIAEWCYTGGAPGLVNYDPEMWLIRNGGWARSIDAAVGLAERVLPGWSWNVASAGILLKLRPCAFLAEPEDNGAPEPWAFDRDVYRGDASTPALALLAAILRAVAYFMTYKKTGAVMMNSPSPPAEG
jgi:hypothetical protein